MLLFRAAGGAAIAAGVLRVLAALPLIEGELTQEWLYTVIDILLLYAIMGIYVIRARRLGLLGFASFAVAVAALSFIGGPDADPFGFSTYEEGAATLVIAMVGLSLAWLRAGERPLLAPLLWFASAIAAGVLSMLPAPLPQYGFVAAGALFGLGFVSAGWDLFEARSAGRAEDATAGAG